MEAQQKQTEAELARSKLSNVRKLIAKLLKTINEVIYAMFFFLLRFPNVPEGSFENFRK